MTQPELPNLPGFDAMADTLEFVRNMWGGMKAPAGGIPGMVMPTLSVDEINKQVADLKAVESWLNVNMNMLRGTIQALEVQSATISTLRSMGNAFGAETKPTAATQAHAPQADDPLQAPAAAGASTAWWNMLQEQFNQAVSSVMAEEKSAAPGKAKAAARKAAPIARKSAVKTASKPAPKSAPKARKKPVKS